MTLLLTYLMFGIAAMAFGVMAVLILRHWREIRLLDPLSMKTEQERQQRFQLIERRFERIRADRLLPVQRLMRQLRHSSGRMIQHWHARVYAFERMYRHVRSPLAAMAPSTRERIQTLLNEGRALIRDQKWSDAERRFLEIVSLNAHQVEAYTGLGTIYLKQKLYPQARETFEFVLKMKKNDDQTCAALGQIAQAEGALDQAEQMYLKAAELNPRQACHAACLAEFYLSGQQPAKAKAWAKRASDREPSSAKYTELSLEAALATGDAKDARQRYQRLRLLTDDAIRLQAWKKKVEAQEAAPPQR